MSKDLLSAAHQVLSNNELEIQELVQRISVARYLPEVTKEAMIAELSPELLKRARDKAFKKRDDDKDTGSGMSGKYVGQRQANKFGAGAKRAETGIKSQGDAMKYYRDKKRAPSGWRVIDTEYGKKVVKE